MTLTDRAILSYMSEYPEMAMGPKIWYYNISQEHDVSYSSVARRFRILKELDEPMVESDPDRGGGLQITEFGLQVAAGEVDVERIKELNPHDDGEDEGDEESG